jgi:hypothetical protein
VELHPTDETLILDGIRRRDDSDRIGNITRNAQRYETQLQAIEDQVDSIMAAVEQTVNQTMESLRDFLIMTRTQLDTILAEGRAHARIAAAELERLLTATSSAQITQGELDALDTHLLEVKTQADAVLEREQTFES